MLNDRTDPGVGGCIGLVRMRGDHHHHLIRLMQIRRGAKTMGLKLLGIEKICYNEQADNIGMGKRKKEVE